MSDEVCRKCGRELEDGAIYSGRWVRWLPRGERAPIGYGQFKHKAVLGVSWGARPVAAAARRCTACRLIEFEY